MRLPDWNAAAWKTAAGYLLVVAALALSLPGVRAVRAEDEVPVISVNLVDSEPICDPNAKPGVTSSTKVYLGSDPEAPGLRLPTTPGPAKHVS